MVMNPSPRDMARTVVLVAQREKPLVCPFGAPSPGQSLGGMFILEAVS